MKSKVVAWVAAAFVLTGMVVPQLACAQGRVSQVNSRIENQEGRTGRKAGKHKMSAAQQTSADEANYRMVAEEQNMRNHHKGHLTRHDQRKLNRQLNRNSNRIKNSG